MIIEAWPLFAYIPRKNLAAGTKPEYAVCLFYNIFYYKPRHIWAKILTAVVVNLADGGYFAVGTR